MTESLGEWTNTGAGRIAGDRITLSVVIPALNEEDGIADIANRVLAVRPGLRSVGVDGLEVIVVDDGSTDRTAEIAESIPGVRVVKHRMNQGYGAAIKTGFSLARGELLAFLDADSTYPPEHFADLCDVIIRQPADVAIGSRRSGGASQMPALRKIGNLVWSCLLSVIGGARVQDPASGMRVLRRESLPQLYPLPDGLNFTPVMSTRAVHEELRVVEMPIPYHERSGRSKLSVVHDGLRFLNTIIWTALEYNPARILELIGFGALAVSALIGASLIGARFNGITDLGPMGVFAVFGSLILAVSGVSLFSLGISFNYLVALSHTRPIRQANLIARILGPSPEGHFVWIGVLLAGCGSILGGISLYLGVNGWEITRLWLWLLGSAMFVLVGVQLLLFSMLIRVLDTLNAREAKIGEDLARASAVAPVLREATHVMNSAPTN